MSENNAKIRISLKDGEFELSGSELFVSQQIESFRELIVESLKDKKFELNAPVPKSLSSGESISSEVPEILSPPPIGGLTGKTVDDFQNVFHSDENGIKIIKKAPGSNKQAKSITTALMYLWAVNSIKPTEVRFSEIRDLCQNQGCLDSANFATHMKSTKEHIIVEGKGKSQTCKITIPGKERALQIIEDLNRS
jgi:hypothetical protein